MKVFSNYARYYDLLYKDKNYKEEVDYVEGLIKQYSTKSVKSILDLGCGTGKHDFLLAEKGYSVTGIDVAPEMIEIAQQNSYNFQISQFSNFQIGTSFQVGDVRSINLNKKFDTVISLFHVASYQTTNDDLIQFFQTAKNHLNEDGLFIFDCWYGPAVLTDRPVERIKRLEDEQIEVTRFAKPLLYPNENIVDVNYTVNIKDKTTSLVEEIKETHRMRYLFKTEIEFLAEKTGLSLLCSEEWITKKNLGFDTWGGCFIFRIDAV